MAWDFLEDLWDKATKPVNFKPQAPNRNTQRPGSSSFGQKGTYGIGQGVNTDRKPGNVYDKAAVKRGAIPSKIKKPSGKPDNNFRKAVNGLNKKPRNNGPVKPNIRQMQERDHPQAMRGMMPEPTIQTPPQEEISDPYGDLLSGLEDFQGPADNGQFDMQMQETEARIMATLDEMLGGQLKGINDARGAAQSGFNTSDGNLAAMHSAFQNDIATKGKEAYQGISNDLTGNLTQQRDSSVGALQALEANDNAQRVAMLKNLGIEEAGAAPASSVYDEASANIVGRTATDLTSANQQSANNQTFNQGLATTTGMQGLQRRAALQQQLQSIMGGLGEKEADARGGYAQAKARAEQDIAEMGIQAQSNGAEQAFKQYQYDQDRIIKRADTLDEQNFQREMFGMENDARNEQMMFEASQKAEKPTQVSGFAGLTQDLSNNYGAPMAQRVTSALSEVYAGTELESRTDSDVRRDPVALAVNALIKRGIPQSVALHAVTNYNQLGTTSKFAPQ